MRGVIRYLIVCILAASPVHAGDVGADAGAREPSTLRLADPAWLQTRWTDYDPATDTLIGTIWPDFMLRGRPDVEPDFSDPLTTAFGDDQWSYTVAVRGGELAWARLARYVGYGPRFVCGASTIFSPGMIGAESYDARTGATLVMLGKSQVEHHLNRQNGVDCGARFAMVNRAFVESSLFLISLDTGEIQSIATPDISLTSIMHRFRGAYVFSVRHKMRGRASLMRIATEPGEEPRLVPMNLPDTTRSLVGVYAEREMVLEHWGGPEGNPIWFTSTSAGAITDEAGDALFLAMVGDRIAVRLYRSDGVEHEHPRPLVWVNVRTGETAPVPPCERCDALHDPRAIHTGDGYFTVCDDGRVTVVLPEDMRVINPPTALDMARAADVPFPVE